MSYIVQPVILDIPWVEFGGRIFRCLEKQEHLYFGFYDGFEVVELVAGDDIAVRQFHFGYNFDIYAFGYL